MVERRGEQLGADAGSLEPGAHGEGRQDPHQLTVERHRRARPARRRPRPPSSPRDRCRAGGARAAVHIAPRAADRGAGPASRAGRFAGRARSSSATSALDRLDVVRAHRADPHVGGVGRHGVTIVRAYRPPGRTRQDGRVRKVGVEEELLLVDPGTGEMVSISAGVLRSHDDAAAQAAGRLGPPRRRLRRRRPPGRARGRAAAAHGRDPDRSVRRPRGDRRPAAGRPAGPPWPPPAAQGVEVAAVGVAPLSSRAPRVSRQAEVRADRPGVR